MSAPTHTIMAFWRRPFRPVHWNSSGAPSERASPVEVKARNSHFFASISRHICLSRLVSRCGPVFAGHRFSQFQVYAFMWQVSVAPCIALRRPICFFHLRCPTGGRLRSRGLGRPRAVAGTFTLLPADAVAPLMRRLALAATRCVVALPADAVVFLLRRRLAFAASLAARAWRCFHFRRAIFLFL